MSTYTDKHKAYYEANKQKLKPMLWTNQQKWLQTPKGIYSAQKRKAKQRNIEWHFTFDSWFKLWEESGHWDTRGDSAGKHCMSRYNDQGPYSPENVYINLFELNTKESYKRNGINQDGTFKSSPVTQMARDADNAI